MDTYSRWYSDTLIQKAQDPYVHILFGARQTGKSTLLANILPPDAVRINLADPLERSRFSANPGELGGICRSLPRRDGPWWVFIDEAQTVPSIFDAIQALYDSDSLRWRFMLCGSSARKLRSQGANLLPGRSIMHRLHPLTTAEYERDQEAWSMVPNIGTLWFPVGLPRKGREELVPVSQRLFPSRRLEDRLVFGDLPGIAIIEKESLKSDLLSTYATAYLEEEIRREIVLKDWGSFVRFLKFAARESGGIVNLSAISKEAGLSAPTIKNYYQLLEDMFIGFSVPAYSGSPRKSALSTPRFFFFDTGVKNAAASYPLRTDLVESIGGSLLEQWVGAELHRRLGYLDSGNLSYFRTKDGVEIDFIVEFGGSIIPIEVKWTDHPSLRDARHLEVFLKELGYKGAHGFIICRCPRPLALSDTITALPWFVM